MVLRRTPDPRFLEIDINRLPHLENFGKVYKCWKHRTLKFLDESKKVMNITIEDSFRYIVTLRCWEARSLSITWGYVEFLRVRWIVWAWYPITFLAISTCNYNQGAAVPRVSCLTHQQEVFSDGIHFHQLLLFSEICSKVLLSMSKERYGIIIIAKKVCECPLAPWPRPGKAASPSPGAVFIVPAGGRLRWSICSPLIWSSSCCLSSDYRNRRQQRRTR